MNAAVSAAVVVCVASDERAALLRACVDSLLGGTRRPDELFVVVDQNPSLEADLRATLPAAVRVLHTVRQGNSEGRNTGIAAARADVVAFVDDDATVEPGWLAALLEPFEGSAALVGAGGAVVPRFEEGPRWLPEELLWVVGCTYRGHRADPGPTRNPIGCNMAFRREALLAAGCFSAEFGKRGNALVICDETELCLRLEQAHGRDRIAYVPSARVHHFVPVSRICWRGLVRRCTMEGLSKARLLRRYRGRALSSERGYVGLLVRRAATLAFSGARRRDAGAALGAVAIVLSLSVTVGAFAYGLVLRRA
jgi:GT2 family glycosyltransferase